jgi:hypothetical protein
MSDDDYESRATHGLLRKEDGGFVVGRDAGSWMLVPWETKNMIGVIGGWFLGSLLYKLGLGRVVCIRITGKDCRTGSRVP